MNDRRDENVLAGLDPELGPWHVDAPLHVSGESHYVDDQVPPAGMLHLAVVGSPVAHGVLNEIDVRDALEHPGVIGVITANDIPGENQIGSVIPDEPLLAEGHVHFQGAPVALVVAENAAAARLGAEAVRVDVDPLPVTVDPRVAFADGQIHGTSRVFASGDVEAAWADCDVIVEGSSDVAGQEHLYLETQRARAIPGDGNRMVVQSSTQGPYAVQKAAARVLGVPEHLVEVDVKRLGGGFGGKEDQATCWGALAALAAHVTGQPVELVLNRIDDLKMTGKRHPYAADWKIGAKADGTLVAFDVQHYQNAGAHCDLSLAVLERTLFHATNAYMIPNVRAFGVACKTHLPPNTAFRGFGGPQGMFAIECAITEIAEALDIDRAELQRKNLIAEGYQFHYGQKAERARSNLTWDRCVENQDVQGLRDECAAFNAANVDKKRGFAMMPICFGIAFTATFLNQASALVHVYTDGSVSVSTGGVEMGQGITTKLRTIAAKTFGIRASRVRLESTNTTRIANMSPSAASATTDLNGGATILAVNQIQKQLFELVAPEFGADAADLAIIDEKVCHNGVPTDWDWEKLVKHAYFSRVALSAHAFYATPGVWFDRETESGEPFAYHVYGTAAVTVTVDCLRGRYQLESVRLVHDLGRPVNPLVDIGQIEGGLAQGLGWMTLEELRYNDDGRLLSHALSTYKAPDAFFMPDDLQVEFVEDENPPGPYGSKAVGEPPLMYGIGAYFAIRDALKAYRPDAGLLHDAPMTPERVLLELHGGE